MLPPSPAPSRAPSYAAVLRTPHAARAFGAALLGRLSYGVVPLSLMLAVKDATGSYSVAGVVMALFGAASVSLSPVRAALVDRFGPRRALPPMAGAYAVLLAVLAYVTWRPGASPLPLGTLAVAAGTCTPPLGPVMRTLWSRLLPDRELLRRAYSLDGVAEELLFVTGPLLVGVVIRHTVPAAGVGIGAALVLVGTGALVSSPALRGPEPSPAARPADVPAEAPDGVTGGRRTLLGIAGLRHAALAAAAVGLCLGGLDLLVVAFAEQHHRGGSVAWVLAALSAGSAVGGLAYGAVPWRAPNGVRLPALVAGLGAALVVAGLSPGVPVLVAVVAAAGVFVAPALTTAYLVADESVEPGARTRAGAWVNTAVNAGSALGGATMGLLVDRLPPPACFVIAAAPALACAAVVARGTPSHGRADRAPAPAPAPAPDADGASRV